MSEFDISPFMKRFLAYPPQSGGIIVLSFYMFLSVALIL